MAGRPRRPSRRSSAKNGPERTRPKSSRSSFITDVSARSPRTRGPPRLTRALAAARASRAASLASIARPAAAPRRAARFAIQCSAIAHEDVLDEAADDRRVVADALDAEAGRGDRALEIRDVGQRVEVIRLAQAFLARSIRPRRSSQRASRLICRRPPAIGAFLPHVRVDEQPPAGRQDARGFAQHVCQRVARQVLEDVERPGLRERAVAEGEPPQVAEDEVRAFARPRARSTG